jgi:hypothetical protein
VAPSSRQQNDEDERGRKRRATSNDEDDQPRNKSRKKRKKGGRVPTWAKLTVGGVLVIVLGVGLLFAVYAVIKSKDTSSPASGNANPSTAPVAGNKASTGSKYIPRVSEKKMEEYFKDRHPSEVTEDEVYAIMGEPTRRDAPVTGRKNGQVFTVYTAYWEVPGSGVKSQIGFANGHVAGVILGLEVTPPKGGSGK